MSVPVLIGFAGVLVAAVATGLLAGRCVRQPRTGFVLCTAAGLGLTIALAAQAMGFSRGFGPVTFRAVQLFALLLAPLWLAWALVELVAAHEAARFGMRLVSAALTVVASVILATDPLSAQPFGKAWPLAGPHFQPISRYALDLVQAFAAVTVVVIAAVAAGRAGRGSRPPAPAVAAVGLAALMTAALRFPLPARAAYPLLTMAAAALMWFGASRVGEPTRRAAGSDGVRGGRRDRVREGRGRYRSGDGPEDDFWPGDVSGPADGYPAEDRYATFGPRGDLPVPGRPPGPGDNPAARFPDGGDRGRRGPSGPPPWNRDARDWPRGPGTAGPGATEYPAGRPPGSALPGAGLPGAGPPRAGLAGAGLAGAGLAGAEPGPQDSPGGSQAAAPARPYGRILIFTLLDDRVADFDRLAEQTAEEVRTGEPDTLVYVIHTVPNAPMQRIFYEIYRDRAAFDSHESQPYMQRFVADRRSYVLATNVIELRLKYAKVAPLPNPQAPAPAQLPAQPQRPYQQPPDRQPPDRQPPDRQTPGGRRDGRQWPDQRQVPSGRRFDGG